MYLLTFRALRDSVVVRVQTAAYRQDSRSKTRAHHTDSYSGRLLFLPSYHRQDRSLWSLPLMLMFAAGSLVLWQLPARPFRYALAGLFSDAVVPLSARL